MSEKQNGSHSAPILSSHPYEYVFDDFDIANLSYSFIQAHCGPLTAAETGSSFDIHPQHIEVNTATFGRPGSGLPFPAVEVKLAKRALLLSCPCPALKSHLCGHQAQVLGAILHRSEIRVFFDATLRQAKIRQVAGDYGMENEAQLDDYFLLEYAHRSVLIKPRLKELLPLSPEKISWLQEALVAPAGPPQPPTRDLETASLVLVLGHHKYYGHLYIELYQAARTLGGKIKNPLTAVNPQDLVWKTENNAELKFYSGITKFQSSYSTEPAALDLEALKAVAKNPLGLPVYYHNAAVAANVTAASLVPIHLKTLPLDLSLEVQVKAPFYEISGKIILEGYSYPLQDLALKFHYFISQADGLYLIGNADSLRIIHFFNKHNHQILVHESKFAAFRQQVLANLENRLRVTYTYLKPGSAQQLQDSRLDQDRQQLIYLSDSEDFVLITPVMKYGEVEIPVLSKKRIYATDARGQAFTLERDEAAEVQLTAAVLQQHPDFQEQLHQDCFYLHKNRFLSDDWFLEAFASWQQQQITVVGFDTLKGHKLNPHKASISVLVTSGINWFDTAVEVRFGKQKVALRYLHKSLRNKSRFVTLGDGSLGILPQEWIERMTAFFQAGHLEGNLLRTAKINFSALPQLYREEEFSGEVKAELVRYQDKVAGFDCIQAVAVPPGLQGTLREYQRQGLNWLNFLDEFNFGGCLADDMGLGKTIQVLAFLLSQQAKGHPNTNLVVVPTSLLFNWQAEAAKFAPSLRLLTLYGPNRSLDRQQFEDHQIILTTYGLLLSDVGYLKDYAFNYIILDESQAIKNPDSQRFRAVRQLQSRNKMVLTGTPVENNTFDLYGQLAFACPGLLGSKQYFKEHYSTPIDKFKDRRRARELQQKINPFVLRRTKEQVAQELPEKTEMVIYCPMGAEQRRVYDYHERQVRDFLLTREKEELSQYSAHVLRGLTRLRQICDSPALLADEKSYGDTSAKIEVLVEQIESKAPRHKILVFSQFVGMLTLVRQALNAKGIACAWLTGQTRNREAAVASFQEDAGVRVFLISLKAGGTGLNLTAADYVYLVDPWWNPAVENQAIDRIYRIGQKKNVVAVRLLCPDTIEAKILTLQQAKRALSSDLIKTDTAILKSLSRQDLLGLFS